MTTLKNNFNKLELQVKAIIIATIVISTIFTVMTITNGFSNF
mgnify:CR=1 FL=1